MEFIVRGRMLYIQLASNKFNEVLIAPGNEKFLIGVQNQYVYVIRKRSR